MDKNINAEIVAKLNEYEAGHTPEDHNIWQDMILPLAQYDDAKTGNLDDTREFALADGTIIAWDSQRFGGPWYVHSDSYADRMAEM